MKGYVEFKGYRTRTTYDPKSKDFLTHGVEYPEFDVRDSKDQAENRAKSTNPPKQELKAQQSHSDTPDEGSVKRRKRSKSKTKERASAHSLAPMTR